MKKIFSGVSIALLGAALFGLDIFTYAPISGNVQSYTQTDFAVTSKFGNYFRTPSAKIIHNLNLAGKEVETTEYSPKDVELSKIISKYDATGNLTEQTCYDSNKEVLWKSVTTFKAGKKVDCSEYGKNGILKGKVIYTYSDGVLSEETGYDGEGAILWKTVYKYDEENRVAEVNEYCGNGQLDKQSTYTYAKNGKIDSISTFDNYLKKTETLVFKFTADGILSQITTYDADKQITKRIIVKCDSSNNVAKVSEYNIAQKFGTTVNELISVSEFIYQ